jgi:serine/threonine protein kinase
MIRQSIHGVLRGTVREIPHRLKAFFSASIDLGGSLADDMIKKPFDLYGNDNGNSKKNREEETITRLQDTLGEDLGGSLGDSEIRKALKSVAETNLHNIRKKKIAEAKSLAANTKKNSNIDSNIVTSLSPSTVPLSSSSSSSSCSSSSSTTAAAAAADNDISSTTKIFHIPSASTLVTPVDDTEKVCPVSSRRRRLRKTCIDNDLEVIRPLGRGSFGRIVLARKIQDGQYYAVKLQRLTGSELTPDQAKIASEERDQVKNVIHSLPETSYIREYFIESLEKLNRKLKTAAPKEGEYRLFDGKQSRRAVAESVILDHLQSNHPDYYAYTDLDETSKTTFDGSRFIVRKHGSFEDREWVYIILDYLTGGTLNDRLNDPKQCGLNGRMKEKDVQFYLAELLMGLKFLQENHVSHRDIKPNNIMLDGSGHSVLMDFGLSTRTKRGLTTFCGTAEYIAPEVLTQKTWDATMLDLWSYGVLMHKLLTGTTPFEALTAKEVFMNILINGPLSNVPKDCELSLEAKSLISALLERDANKRATIDDVMKHDFFNGIDWDVVLRREMVPPWVPDTDMYHDLEDGIIHL